MSTWLKNNDRGKKTTEREEGKIIDKIDTTIYEMPDLPKTELGGSLLNTLGTRAGDILANEFVNNKDIEQKTIEQIKDKYNFDEISNNFDNAAAPHQLECFYGRGNKNF